MYLDCVINNNRKKNLYSILQSLLGKNLLNNIPMLGTDKIPIRVSTDDYIDAHPNDKLIMLTNDSSTPLEKLEPHQHYVLGACVKLNNQNRFIHAKAKQFNIKTARLPIDLYRRLRCSKLLPLDQITQILLEFKYSRNWDKAFEFIGRHQLK